MTATEITATSADGDGLAHVWFANTATPMAYVTLCRELDDDGEKAIYVERDDQKWSSHGGVERAILTRSSLLLSFSQDAGISLGLSRLEIDFQLGNELFHQLKESLAVIFAGSSSLVMQDEKHDF